MMLKMVMTILREVIIVIALGDKESQVGGRTEGGGVDEGEVAHRGNMALSYIAVGLLHVSPTGKTASSS